MNKFISNSLYILLSASLFITAPVYSCDDTLVMLLTAKNPTSEFSKTIRSFMNSLTVLGTALKYSPKEDYSTEVNGVLDAWLEFSKKYMTNPPEEAKNDRQWREKMGITARKIGEIRKLVNNKQYLEAHNNVLELSNTIGTFFEAVGITDEKQIFISTSADINDLQRLIDNKSKQEAQNQLKKVSSDLEAFKKYITADDASSASNTAKLIDEISQALSKDESAEVLDQSVSKLRTSFEELRSRILMQEWFSDDATKQERK